MASNYSEKLRDPRWQKKRLQIMERDGWKCQFCGSEKDTLNVHHKDYVYGREPWDYPDDWLITYCQSCHEADLKYRAEVEREIIHELRLRFYCADLETFRNFIDEAIQAANEALSKSIREFTNNG
ncbi:MAG: hypothetical protein P3T54_00075 [Dehalogenimonas sp.]|nr:hypothetical protein [Dehalogenimonas sp.]